MPSRVTPFVDGAFYHIFNRGVNKQDIFTSERDYQRFLETLVYYQFEGPKPRFSTHKKFRVKDYSNHPKIVDIICYCLMPNHFHMLLKQLKDGGIVEFLGKISNSYTKYFNTKHLRSGPLFSGEFKSVTIESDEQLLHVSRYIHLNPYVSDITQNLDDYTHSSYMEYMNLTGSLCAKDQILGFFKSPQNYRQFIKDYEGYARDLWRLKHLTIDLE